MNSQHFRRAAVDTARGFTLVELVVAIVVGAIVVGMATAMVGAPVDSYIAQSRRADLVDAADRVSREVTGDFANVLPNSVRISSSASTEVVQFLATTDVAYFTTVGPSNQQLDLSGPDQQFYAYGGFTNGAPAAGYLAVNSSGAGLGDPWRTPATVLAAINAANFGVAVGGSVPITLTAPFWFRGPSTMTQRLFVVSEPVTYICNRTTQTLRRFHRHLISPVAPIVETDPQLTNAGSLSGLVATGVTACAFTCGAGATPCQRSLALKLTLTRGTAPNTESIQVFREVGLDNTP